MIKLLTKQDIYVEGLPAEHEYQLFVDFFLKEHQGNSVLDVGCGTGGHGLAIKKMGYEYEGIDLNKAYVASAKKKGLKAAVMDATKLKYADNSVDNVLMFEVLEHIPDYKTALQEAIRVAKQRVLLTVPNNSELNRLQQANLTYWHIHTSDHVNFFSVEVLSSILFELGVKYQLMLQEPIFPHRLLPQPVRKLTGLFYRLGLVKPDLHYRIYGVIYK